MAWTRANVNKDDKNESKMPKEDEQKQKQNEEKRRQEQYWEKFNIQCVLLKMEIHVCFRYLKVYRFEVLHKPIFDVAYFL